MRTTAMTVCCLLVLSGCTGLAGGGGFPSGTNETHVNETALVLGHQSALDNQSYTVVSYLNVTGVGPTAREVGLRDERTDIRVAAGGTPYHVIRTRGNVTTELYGAEGTVYRRVESPDGVGYTVFEPGAGGPPRNETVTGPSGLGRLAAPPVPNYTLDRREGGFLGPTVFVFRAEGAEIPGDAPPPAAVRNLSATLRVTGDGLVRSYEVRTPLGEGSMNRTIRVTGVGSTDVSEPAWLDAARANATGR